MIPSIRSGVSLVSSTLSRATTTKWAPLSRYNPLTISVIRSVSDEQNCPSCKTTKELAVSRFGSALLDSDTYKAVVDQAPKECVAMKNDSFESSIDCAVADRLRRANRELDPELKPNVKYCDHGTTEIFMSAFLKRDDLGAGESDLTGDSGKLALEMIGSREVDSFSGYVVDIGGQDSAFVKEFKSASKRIVMDKNAIAWALDKSPEIEYALGGAEQILRDSRFLSEDPRPQTIFAMSNFINVLSPEVAWNTLEATVNRMNPGDRLIITNLDRDNFFEDSVNDGPSGAVQEKVVKGKYYEDEKSELLGIHVFNKKETGAHYKSTISCYRQDLI